MQARLDVQLVCTYTGRRLGCLVWSFRPRHGAARELRADPGPENEPGRIVCPFFTGAGTPPPVSINHFAAKPNGQTYWSDQARHARDCGSHYLTILTRPDGQSRSPAELSAGFCGASIAQSGGSTLG